MLLLAVAGISCQLLLLQNAIFSQQNQATIAFTTPTNVAPSNLLMCFNSTSVQLNPLTFSVVALTENGQVRCHPRTRVQVLVSVAPGLARRSRPCQGQQHWQQKPEARQPGTAAGRPALPQHGFARRISPLPRFGKLRHSSYPPAPA